ncbi:uncharacterized protein LOC123508585 [Portunus trituberculatus]|uniref:uncharacterized protein LOC123508585 n=1 Tax=Portunus trituberculatus TaxID=210409 RepID=UPI001E1CCD16|nr:uncharacterized protein LOC123508585 [Portunus trituberculatus]
MASLRLAAAVVVVVAAAAAGLWRSVAADPALPVAFREKSTTYNARKESLEEVDLLQAIAVPFEDPSTQYFVTGFDGFPAFGFKVGASIKHPFDSSSLKSSTGSSRYRQQ